MLEVWADVVGGIRWDSTFMGKEKETGEGMDDRKGSRQRRLREGKGRYSRGRRSGWGQTDGGGAAGSAPRDRLCFRAGGRVHTLGPQKVMVHPLPCK